MNIELVDKWLENEYGVSYTRLEELHDFVVEQDLKHQEKTEENIKQLNIELQKYKNAIYKIETYINCYSPYFLETQEENNKKIASIIHEELE